MSSENRIRYGHQNACFQSLTRTRDFRPIPVPSMPVAVSATLFLKKVAKYCNDRPAECRLRLAMPSAVSPPRSSSMLSPDAPPSRSGCWRRRPRWPSRPTSTSLSGHTARTRTALALSRSWRWQPGSFCATRPAGAAGAAALTAAYASHLALDWTSKDTSLPSGLTALWPFTSRYYKSGLDLFGEISRRYWLPDEFIIGNVKAAMWELRAAGALPVSCLGILE